MTEVTATVVSVRNDIPLPAVIRKAGGRRANDSLYPFDKLDAPQNHNGNIYYSSFPVFGKTVKQAASLTYAAARRYADVSQETGEGGVVRNVYNKTREFKAVAVDPATDPDKASVRVFRVK